MVAIRVYVEGGGDYRVLMAECRHGFSELFKKVMPPRSLPAVIACGSRTEAFKKFCTGVKTYPDAFCILLVDSEGPVPESRGQWDVLHDRDSWNAPPNVTDENCHLMVQLMESWFLTDKDALERYYGQGFNRNALPARADTENIPKEDVQRSLDNATRHTQAKGRYAKAHAFKILALIRPEEVRKLPPGTPPDAPPNHAGRLFDTLLRKCRP